ncbi:MAG: NAD(P)/FAD-dependent oxidoreductase [Dongiaceae bacterium]
MSSLSTADVIVVGAGIAGASCAFHLAGMGVRTTLIERRHPAAGPTGKSSAICHAFYLMPELSQLGRRGIEILRDIPALTGGPPCFHQVGMLWVVGEDAAPDWSAAVERIRGEGAEIENLPPDAVRRLAPRFNHDGVALGVWEPTCGYADPYDAANALAQGARARGARLLLNTEVSQIHVSGGRAAGVETQDGQRIAADAVVVAAGVWTKPLLGKLSVDLPIHVERHPMAVLDAPQRARDVLPFAWCDDILCNYARPEGESAILVGTWAGGGTGLRHATIERPAHVGDPDVYDETVDAAESAEILQFITPRVPEMETLGVRKGYAGLYDMSPDDNPIIDRVPGIEGAFVICGSSGHGFKLGPAVGEEVARWVTAGRSDLLAPFALGRFG